MTARPRVDIVPLRYGLAAVVTYRHLVPCDDQACAACHPLPQLPHGPDEPGRPEALRQLTPKQRAALGLAPPEESRSA